MTIQRLEQDHIDAIERTALRITRCSEDAQIVCIEVLDELDAGALESFAGRSTLRTWLIAMTRNKAIDLRRRRLGRRTVPSSVSSLGPAHASLFQLYFLDGLPYGEARAALLRKGLIGHGDAIADLLGEVMDVLDPRTMHRIHWDLPTSRFGPAEGRLLEAHDELRRQAMDRSATLDPEFAQHDERIRRTLEALTLLRAQLPDDERRVLEMKFDHNMTASDIAETLGLPGPRKVFTMLDRSLRTLRRLMTAAGLSMWLWGVCLITWNF